MGASDPRDNDFPESAGFGGGDVKLSTFSVRAETVGKYLSHHDENLQVAAKTIES